MPREAVQLFNAARQTVCPAPTDGRRVAALGLVEWQVCLEGRQWAREDRLGQSLVAERQSIENQKSTVFLDLPSQDGRGEGLQEALLQDKRSASEHVPGA